MSISEVGQIVLLWGILKIHYFHEVQFLELKFPTIVPLQAEDMSKSISSATR
jgi:hypothetical protein